MSRFSHIQTQVKPPVQRTDYFIGSDLLANLDKFEVLKAKKFSSYLLLSDTTIFKLYGNKVVASLEKLGKPAIISLIKPGEKHKLLSETSAIITPYFKVGLDRKSCLVALGGGVITDLGGFIASILLRGISAVYLPTTLLGQIDAAIGGKTGVDFQLSTDSMVKNMIGTIRQPSIVISDTDTLRTLPEKEILNGLGEMVKYWVGWRRPTLRHLGRCTNALLRGGGICNAAMTPPMVKELIKTISLCQKIKIDIIQKDPLETKGLRQKLNLGHTIGHAIEGALDGKLSHGQAVAVGLVAAGRISVEKGMLDKKILLQINNLLATLGLPREIIASQYSVTRSDLVSAVNNALKLDKKAGTFVLIKDIGKLVTGISVEKQLINKILQEVIL